MAPQLTVRIRPVGACPGGGWGCTSRSVPARRRVDDLEHDAVIHAPGPFVGESSAFAHLAGAVIQERARHDSIRRVERVRLDDAAAGLRDQVEHAGQCSLRDAAPTAAPVHEEATQPAVRHGPPEQLDLLAVPDAGQLRRAAVLTPAHGKAAVEHERRVRPILTHRLLLVLAPGLRAVGRLEPARRQSRPAAPARWRNGTAVTSNHPCRHRYCARRAHRRPPTSR